MMKATLSWSRRRTKISSYAFYECRSLKEINIPDSVTSIGMECFLGCRALKKISFGKNVKKLGMVHSVNVTL